MSILSEDIELAVGDEVYSTVAKPPYGMVIEDDSRDGYVSVFWASGLIGGLKKEWLHKTGKHYPIENWMKEMREGRRNMKYYLVFLLVFLLGVVVGILLDE